MPYYPRRRRRYIRRRYGFYGPYRARWWKRFGRRRRFRRGYPVRFLRLLRKKRFRRRLRKRRFKARRRRRIIGPFSIRYYVPPVKKKCIIKLWCPLLYYNRFQLNKPFVDMTSQTYLGGSMGYMDFDLRWLYEQALEKKCRWTRSNYGYEYARFHGCKIKFYRHDYDSYAVKYYQGNKVTTKQNWMDIHPFILLQDTERVIVPANHQVPLHKRHKPKKLFIKRGPGMTTEWYTMCEMSDMTLFRLGISLIDFKQPFQDAAAQDGYYYLSLGYKTPDRRTMSQYKRPTGPSGTYTSSDIAEWGAAWVTWGGFINTWLPYNQLTWWCCNKFPELASTQKQSAPLDGAPGGCYTQGTYPPAIQLRWYKTFQNADFDTSGQFMFKYCSKQITTPDLSKVGHPIYPPEYKSLYNTIPSNQFGTVTGCSRSSHQSHMYNTLQDAALLDKNTTRVQGFWGMRYNWIYDGGEGNVVYGMYIPHDLGARSTFKFMMQGWGPGTGSDGNFTTVHVSTDIPYWLEFYGHTYRSYLAYINARYPHIKDQSYQNYGFIGIAVRGFPSERVASGPFQEGFAPLTYTGSNYEYFTADKQGPHPWIKYWRPDSNQSPINDEGEIDRNCWIFCILRDGRTVLQGSGLEGSLLLTNNKDGFWKEKFYTTMDDVYALGRAGPFVVDRFSSEEMDRVNVHNITAYMKFYFQWGGYHHPGHFRAVVDPRTEGKCPDPRGGREDDDPYNRHRVRRHVTSVRENGIVHPEEVSAQAYYPPRDLGDDGLIRESAFKRLTQHLPSSALGGRVPRRSGGRTGNELCDSIADQRRSESSYSTEPETSSQASETPSPPPSPPRAKRVKRPEAAHHPQQVRGSHVGGEGSCLPCTLRWKPHSTGTQHHLLRLERKQQRREQLHRLKESLEAKLQKKRSRSCGDLSFDSSLDL
ncbi:ORF1 [torque teno Delphinidae virus 1]